MKTNKTGIFTKIISCFLCTAITLQVGLALTVEKVNAAGSFSEAEGFISVSDGSSGKIITVNSQDEEEGVILSIKDQDNPEGNETGYRVVLYVDSLLEDDPNPLEETIDKIEKINILGSSMLTVYSKKIETEIYIENENGSVNTSQGSTLKITRLSGFGIINNQGTLQFSDYDSDDYSTEECAIHIANSGTIIADNIDISTTYAVINGDETPTVSQGENSIYQATTSFTKGEDDMLGKVVANPDTKIISAGGTFNLQVGDIEKEITGAVNTTADKLVFKDPNPILGNVPDVYYGQDLDSIFIDYVSVNEGYDKTKVYFEYADSMQNTLEDKPVTPSEYSYNVHAVAPADGSYYGDVSDWKPFKISYLELTDLYPEGTTSFVSASGYDSYDSSDNKYYFGNSIVLTPPEGILIGCPTSPTIEGYSSSVSIPISELVNNDGSINQDFTIEFRRDDGATTSGISILDVLNNIDNYVFDDKDPEIYAAGDDGNTINPNNPPEYYEHLDLDGSLVDLWFLDIIVSDDNLASVVINVDGTEIDYSNSITDGKCLITVQCPAFETKEFSITATDKAGRVSQGQLKMENFYHYGIDFLSISNGNSGKIYTFTPSEKFNAAFFYIHDVSEGVMNSRYESEEEMKEWGLDPNRSGYDFEIVTEKKDGVSGGGWIGWTEENIERLEIDGENLTVVSSAHIETEVSFGDESSELQILEGSTFTFKNLSGGQGTITNSGTIVFSDYDSADYSTEDCAIKIINNGTIIADNIDISTNYADAISQSENSVFQITASKANTSFTKGDEDILGKVIANSDTVIKSAGGTFTLQVGNETKEISGVITNKTASQLMDYEENGGAIFESELDNGGTRVTLQTVGSSDSEPVTFTIKQVTNGYEIECDKYRSDAAGAGPITVSSIDMLTIDGYQSIVSIQADIDIGEFDFVGGNFNVIIEEGYTVTCSKISGPDEAESGTLTIDGTLIIDNFVTSEFPKNTIVNNGTIDADIMDFTYLDNLQSESDSLFLVGSSFILGTDDLEGTVIASDEYTKIKSAGGKFTLYLTGASGTFEGEIDSTAGELLLEPIEITIDTDGLPGFDIENPLIAGEEYDFDYAIVTNPEGYEHYAYLEYAKIISDEFSTTQPTDLGFYKVRAVIPSSSEHSAAVSPEYIFSIQNIALSDLFPDGKYNVSVSGCYNSYYVPEALVLEAPEGVGICIPALIDESDFFKPYVFYDDLTLSYETLMENGLLVDGHIDGNLIIAFARLEDVEDAEGLIAVTTAGGTAIKNVIPGIENFVFDSYDPGFDAMAVDSEGGLVEVSVDGEDPITADELRITVSDENLATVTVSIDGTVTDLSDSIEDGACEITLYPAEGKAQDIKITAKDLANRESLVEFTLCPETVEPTLVVTLPDTIYYGDEIKPTISINENYEGDITVSYYDPETDTTSTSAPKNAGTYLLIASAKATDYYAETSTEVEFKILPKAIEAESLSVAIDNIKYGEEPVPSVTGLPNDYLGTITYTYTNSEGAEHASGETFTAGTYTVLATISDTNNYTGTTCEAEFTVSKYEIENVTVTVASIKVGDKPAPSVTGLPEDYTAEPLFTYTDSKGVSHSADDLFTEGTYTVLATILPTDKYKGTSCETTFTVGKNEVTATVSVADIFVGETPNPVVTTVSDGKVTIEYKTADTEYTTTVPTAAGEYTVRATVAESDMYLETTCTDTFTISKNEVTTARVSVADIFVGETPNPVVSTDSDGKAVFEYKISTAPDTTYTSEVPTAAGTYMVRATIPETDTYLGTTCTANFDILKNEVKASLAVADIKVGGTVKPVIKINPEDYDGTVSYQYKISTAEDSTYTSAVPTAAGTYMVKATLPATDKYLGTTCTTNFDIVKNDVTASVSVDDILVGGTVKPVVTTDPEDYDGVITFEYKGNTDAAFSKTVPTVAGTYTVRATLPETAKFFGTTCTDTFTISKNAVTATVSVADIFIGETPKPVVTTDPKGYDGVITFEYKESSEADTAYTSAVPTAAGRYTVRATLSSTANFLGTSCEDSFSIVRKEVTASVSVANIYVGQTPSPVVITESDGKDKATFEYKLSSDPDTAFTTTAPTKLGTYTCKATIPETDKYLAITCSCEFVINLNPVGVLELSVPDTYYGLTVSSSYNTDSDGEVSIVYKTAGAPDTTYASAAPTKVGDYTAMITVSETETYESASTTTNFKISYLEAPATAFVPKGTEGNNGYFTSDVDLTAPAGYTISTTLGSGYSGSVAYTESLGSIFLKRDDGALTAAISISDRPKIDKVAPVISSASGVMYVDSMSISVSDKNLMSLTVNGSPVAVSGGSASVTLKRPEKGSKTFTIVAEDEAGNITTIELTLMEEWLSDRKVPEGQAVSLVAGEIYYFNEGEWIVSIVNSDGTVTECSTVFSCNLPFYVNSSGDYIFTRVT